MNRPARTDFRTTMTRRRLLGGLSGLTVALTTPIWKSATAFAAAQPAKRFIGVFSANGTVPKDFWPPGTAADAPLTLGPILAPLEKYRQQMLVVGGVHMTSTIGANKPGGPHMKGPGAMLTGGTLLPGSFTGAGGPAGYADHMSVDQAIANRIGTMTKFPSLEFGVRIEGQEPLRVISYRDANKPNKAVDDPSQIYTRMFADPTAGISPAQLAQLQAERKSVLDFLKDDLSRLSTKFTTSDRARLDSHLEGVRRIERQLGTSVQSCSMTMPAKIDPRAMANFPMIGKIQMDLMILALTCGMTNVATLMWANADSWQYFPWIGVNEEHHTMSHAGLNDALTMDKLTKINKWHAEQFAYMLDGLAAVSEPDGSKVLDNTLLLWGNEIGVGNTHTYMNIPWVIAGGTGGYFKMGRYLQYQNQPHNNLLISICHALGLQDVTTFGDPTLSTGPLPGLTA